MQLTVSSWNDNLKVVNAFSFSNNNNLSIVRRKTIDGRRMTTIERNILITTRRKTSSATTSKTTLRSDMGYPSSFDDPSNFLSNKPKGSAATPMDKQKVAVFGAGGYLGSTIFGFIQRASSLYGTGLGGSYYTPRCIGATSTALIALQSSLVSQFKLAFVGESSMRLTNMQDVKGITQSLNGMDAAVLGTVYTLESRPITTSSYGKTPNDKTYEFYLDDKSTITADVSSDEMSIHLALFRNSVQACKDAGLKHLIILETPCTTNSLPFADILDEIDINFTYIHCNGPLINVKGYTYEDGIQSNLDIQGFALEKDYLLNTYYSQGDWARKIAVERKTMVAEEHIPREDVAAVVVQSLLSLDWTRSRCLEISSKGKIVSKSSNKSKGGKKEYVPYVKRKVIRPDRKWCVNSELLAVKLTPIV